MLRRPDRINTVTQGSHQAATDYAPMSTYVQPGIMTDHFTNWMIGNDEFGRVHTCQETSCCESAASASIMHAHATPKTTPGYALQTIRMVGKNGYKTLDDVGLDGLKTIMETHAGADPPIQVDYTSQRYLSTLIIVKEMHHSTLCVWEDIARAMQETCPITQRSFYGRTTHRIRCAGLPSTTQ